MLDENDKDASRTYNFIKSAAGRWFTVFISFIDSMKTAELRKKSAAELKSLLAEKLFRAEELVLLLHQKKAKNVKELRGVKKYIARLKTLLREQKL